MYYCDIAWANKQLANKNVLIFICALGEEEKYLLRLQVVTVDDCDFSDISWIGLLWKRLWNDSSC